MCKNSKSEREKCLVSPSVCMKNFQFFKTVEKKYAEKMKFFEHKLNLYLGTAYMEMIFQGRETDSKCDI